MSARMTDRHGNTVTAISLDGVQQYVARAANGIVLGAVLGVASAPLTTPEHLAAVGIDLASLSL